MSEFLNECCTVKTNRRTIGKAPALKAKIVACNVCGCSYTQRITKLETIIVEAYKPIIETK